MSIARYFNPRLRRMILEGREPAWLLKHPRRGYIRAAVLSCPDWVDRAEMGRLRERAKELTRTTGVVHVMDHDVPLNHPRVCGLTVPWNISIIPHAVNAHKGNRWCPEQMELELWLR